MLERKFFACCFYFLLILLAGFQTGTAMTSDSPEEAHREAARSDADARSDAEAGSASVPSAATMAAEISEMKELIYSQRRHIEQLQAELEQQKKELGQAVETMAVSLGKARPSAEATSSTSQPAQAEQAQQSKVDDVELIKGELEAVADSAAQANQRLTKIEADTTAYNKANDAKIKQLGNFNFSGDVRVRYEPFIQEGAITRNRERVRLRFNVTGKLSDEFSGGLSLATGSLDDPVSTNQTFTSFFNRKNFGIDKAYVTYKPKYAQYLKLEAGKFAFPWYRTSLSFDSDVNPEGFAETLSFDLKSSALKNITFVGFQLPIHESSSSYDSFVLGGQIQTHFRINSRARLSLYGAGININRADPIAVSVGNGTLKPSLSNSNTFRKNSNGAVIGYATKFAYLDTIVKLELDTHPRLPTVIQFNFLNNTRGSRERSAYWAELVFGRAKESGDVQFGYSFIRIEKDAVIGAWNESDLRSATNVRNHKLQFAYMLKGNLTAQFSAWIGKLANPLDNTELVPSGVRGACTGAIVSGCEDPYLKRLQFDLIYKF